MGVGCKIDYPSDAYNFSGGIRYLRTPFSKCHPKKMSWYNLFKDDIQISVRHQDEVVHTFLFQKIIHDFFLNTIDHKAMSFKARYYRS